MLRKIFLTGVLGLIPAAALVTAGCTSSNADKPYGLTGSSTMDDQERKERLRWNAGGLPRPVEI